MIAASVLLTLTLAPAVPQQPLGQRQRRPQAPYSLPPVSGESRDGSPVVRLVPEAAPAAVQLPVVHGDDGVPLPIPAVRRETASGDIVEVPASGDPFFLGFAAGRRYPPSGELVAQEVYDAGQGLGADGRPRPETYAFVMFSKRMTPERLALLEQEGCRLLGFHPHYTQKVALSAAAIDRVAALDFVRWVGAPTRSQKLHPELTMALGGLSPNEPFEAWINVFETDVHAGSVRRVLPGSVAIDPQGARVQLPDQELESSWVTDGWQSRALEGVGVEVLEFSSHLNAFRGRVMPQGLDLITALDFVQFVERDLPATNDHDESMAMVNQDDVRSFYDGSVNQVAIAGIADGGVDPDHIDLSFYGIGQSFAANPDPFQDDCGHGTHVAGTITGKGTVEPGHTGAAPGLGFDSAHPFHVARIFSTCNFPQNVDNTALMNWSTTVQSPSVTIPHVFNNSWGAAPPQGGPAWVGSEFEPRLYDNASYLTGQLYVNSSGNSGPQAATINRQASAKAVLVVGSVTDNGSSAPTIVSSSSRGPLQDGRWKPSVVAPGSRVTSVDWSDPFGYRTLSGTSMAAPHVTGLVASMIDKSASTYAFLPERITAQLMATATRNDNEVISGPSSPHLDNYGAGRIDGTSALWSGGGGTWTNWGFSLFNNSTFANFTVPPNATRLVVVMNYTEPPASAGASAALINNFDLYLDRPPLTSGNNTGEYTFQQSSVDNTEIRVIDNPPVGTWRWKIWPQSTFTVVNAAVSVYVQTSDTTPDITPVLTASEAYANPFQPVTFDYQLTTGGVPLSSAYLETSSSASGTFTGTRTTLADGIVTDLSGNSQGGLDVMLGNIHPWLSREASWDFFWFTEGVHSFCVQAFSDNASNSGHTECVNVTVDGTAPPTPAPLSLAFFPNVWSKLTSGTMFWSNLPDNLSGVDGYSYSVTSTPQNPPQVINLPGTPIAHTISTSSTGTYWFNLAAVDKAGNWSGTGSYGPILIDLLDPTAPTGVQTNVPLCTTDVQLTWNAGTDPDSGIAGYGVSFDQTQFSGAPTTITTTSTSYTQTVTEGTWWAHVRSIDNAGNASFTVNVGPLIIDPTHVSTYCSSKLNSQGCLPAIGWIGSAPSASAGSGFHVISNNTLDNKSGMFFYGYVPKASAFQGGWLCVQAPVKRTAVQNSGGTPPCGGLFTYDFNAHIASGVDPSLTAGTTVYGQYWSRDPGVSFNTIRTDAIQMTLCP